MCKIKEAKTKRVRLEGLDSVKQELSPSNLVEALALLARADVTKCLPTSEVKKQKKASGMKLTAGYKN